MVVRRLLTLKLAFISTLFIASHRLIAHPEDLETREATLGFDPNSILREIDEAVSEHFYRDDFKFDDWRNSTKALRRQANSASSHEDFASSVNAMLEKLNASHTHYFSKFDPRRYQLVGVFEQLFDQEPESFFRYRGIGIQTEFDVTVGHYRVVSVYDGFPADKAGIAYGDLIQTVDSSAFKPIRSFQGRSGSVRVELSREGKKLVKQIPVVELDGRNMFETALTNSVRVIKRDGKSIGYLHVWSYAGSKYHDLVKNELLFGELANCDALVFDIRDGWGGADLAYLDLFREPAARVSFQLRDQQPSEYKSVWGNPVALVTNERSTSGKELFSYGFKKLSLGKVVGTKTAGAVLGGRCFQLSNNDVLYLAVLDVKVDGTHLEGVGVVPDFVVERGQSRSAETDEQLEKAIQVLLGEA